MGAATQERRIGWSDVGSRLQEAVRSFVVLPQDTPEQRQAKKARGYAIELWQKPADVALLGAHYQSLPVAFAKEQLIGNFTHLAVLVASEHSVLEYLKLSPEETRQALINGAERKFLETATHYTEATTGSGNGEEHVSYLRSRLQGLKDAQASLNNNL